MTKLTVCPKCSGEGKQRMKCSSCKGKGGERVHDGQNFWGDSHSHYRKCARCKGEGTILTKKPCSVCKGKGEMVISPLPSV